MFRLGNYYIRSGNYGNFLNFFKSFARNTVERADFLYRIAEKINSYGIIGIYGKNFQNIAPDSKATLGIRGIFTGISHFYKFFRQFGIVCL